MSHRLLASIWAIVVERTDIASIVNEAIGQHTTCPLSFVSMGLATWSLTLLFKIVFDVQRIYPQAPKPSLSSRSYLLSPSQVLLYLHYVLYCSPRAGKSEYQPAFRRLVLLSMLSGVRLLSLHRSTLFFSNETEPLEACRATLWTPTTVERASIDEMVQTLTEQVRTSDDFER